MTGIEVVSSGAERMDIVPEIAVTTVVSFLDYSTIEVSNVVLITFCCRS